MNNALNMNEIERGLMDLSIHQFSTDKFYLQEGQYLSDETISQWLSRKTNDDVGLNPTIENKTDNVLEDEKGIP